MRSNAAGMPKGGSSADAPPLIDFGVDDHRTGGPSSAWPDQASQDVDPFSWTTDELFISATPRDPFGFEGLFTAAPASNSEPFEAVAPGSVGNAGHGFASQSVGFGGGMDLLTGMSPPAPDVGTSPWAAMPPSGHRESVDTRLPGSSRDGTTLFNDNPFMQAEVEQTDAAQPWSPFNEEISFKDALSEDLPTAESPTSEDTGNAVDWSSIVLSEKKAWAAEDHQGMKVSGTLEQASSGARIFTEKEARKPPVAAQVKEKSSFTVTEKDGFRSEAAMSANARLVAQVSAPPQKPAPPRSSSSQFQSSAWASSSRSGTQQPEFLASGGGKGLYRAPSRGIFSAGNPVALELRPRPLKLKEVNQSIRTIMCTDTSVWAAFDHGLKVWDIEAACRSCSDGSNNPLGDEDAAGYTVLTSGPTLCLAMDTGNQVVWTGHRDGKIITWPLNIRGGHSQKREPTEHVLVWDGHQAPVTAMTITPYGEARRTWNALEWSFCLGRCQR